MNISIAPSSAPAAETSVAARLADYVLAVSFGDLPAAVRTESVRTLVNYAGCALGGAPTPTVDAALRGLQSFASPGQARVIGRRERLEPAGAALVNCLSSAAHAFDDTHLKTITHPTGPVISALFALAGMRKTTGEEFLLALMLGMEIECRLSSVLVAPGAGSSGGWYITGVTGGIGAAAAVGRVLGFDRARMVSAMGLAAAQSCGVRGTHASMACAFVPATAAQAGFTAAMLAESGFECGAAALAGRNGLVEIIAPNADHDAICRDLGTTWEVLGNAYKPYPCGIVIHPAIDACLALVREHVPDPDAIESVAFEVNPGALRLCWRKLPNSVLEAQVSLYHWLAAALVTGQAGIAQAGLDCIEDPKIRAIQSRLDATANPALAIDQAKAAMRMRDGAVLTATIEHGIGSLAKPMSDDELSAKFAAQARGVLNEDQSNRLLAACWDFRSLDNAAEILALGAIT